MKNQTLICLCTKVSTRTLRHLSLRMLMFCALIGLAGLVLLDSECSFSQTHNKGSKAGGSLPNVWNTALDPRDFTKFKIPKAKIPYNNLIVLVGDEWTLNVQASKHVKRLGAQSTRSITLTLSDDGTFGGPNLLLSSQKVPPESVVETIELHCKMYDNCVLKLKILDSRVDHHSVFKAIKSLGGIEEKFKRFQITACFSEVPSLKPELKHPATSGKTHAPVDEAHLNSENGE